jgi:hypothetical protein
VTGTYVYDEQHITMSEDTDTVEYLYEVFDEGKTIKLSYLFITILMTQLDRTTLDLADYGITITEEEDVTIPPSPPATPYTDYVAVTTIFLDDNTISDIISASFTNVGTETIIALKMYAEIVDAFGDNVDFYNTYQYYLYDDPILSGETTSTSSWYVYDTGPYAIASYGIYEIAFQDGTTWLDERY